VGRTHTHTEAPRPVKNRAMNGLAGASDQLHTRLGLHLLARDARGQLRQFQACGVTSITARSVMMRSTTPLAVSGKVHWGRILRSSLPSFFLATCSMSTMTRGTPA